MESVPSSLPLDRDNELTQLDATTTAVVDDLSLFPLSFFNSYHTYICLPVGSSNFKKKFASVSREQV